MLPLEKLEKFAKIEIYALAQNLCVMLEGRYVFFISRV